jgi:hypothetical protein
MKERKVKTGVSRAECQWERVKVRKYDGYCSVETVLRRERSMRENDGGVNLIKIHCKHTCKCHSNPPPYNCSRVIKKFLILL